MPTRLHTADKAPAPHKPRALWQPAALFLQLLFSAATVAQTTPDLQHLVFEPVAIEVQPGETAGTYAVTELASLPRSKPVNLRTWEESRRLARLHENPASLEADITRYESVITDIELAGGPYDPRLDQELLSLGELYRQSGQYARALGVLERASHVNRVNSGLLNASQIPIIEKIIENLLARGDIIAANAQHEYLFYLERRLLGDRSVDLLPALTRYADWSMFAYSARPQQIALPEVVDPETAANAAEGTDPGIAEVTNLQGFRSNRLVNAQNMYQTIIRILISNFGPGDPRLPDFEKRLALASYFFATTFDPTSDPNATGTMAYNSLVPYETSGVASNSLGYRQGKEALERRVHYLTDSKAPSAQDLARAHVDLGDWLLKFRKRTEALEEYNLAHAALQQAGVAETENAKLFGAAVPVPVPEFLTHPYSRKALDIPADVALEYQGFIDVEFSINRYGAAGPVTVLGKSPGVAEFVESRLLRTIRNHTFRPHYDNGVVRESSLLRLRYYYTL